MMRALGIVRWIGPTLGLPEPSGLVMGEAVLDDRGDVSNHGVT